MNEKLKTIFFIIGLGIIVAISIFFGRCSRDGEVEELSNQIGDFSTEISEINTKLQEVDKRIGTTIQGLQDQLSDKARADAEFYQSVTDGFKDLSDIAQTAWDLDNELEQLIDISGENAEAKED